MYLSKHREIIAALNPTLSQQTAALFGIVIKSRNAGPPDLLTSSAQQDNFDNMVVRLSDKYALSCSPRLPEQVAAIIAREIRDRFYVPGAKLPPESQLSDAFGVSRSVVREALSQLKYEGLLNSRQGKGVIVLDPSARKSFRMGEIDRLSKQDLAQFYEMRAVIESETAALAASRRSPNGLMRLRNCLARMAQAVEDRTDGTGPDLEFHRIIAEMSGNKYLKDLMDYLNSKAGAVIRTARNHSSRDAKLPAAVQKEHEEIFQALETGDADAARACSLRHLNNAARRLGIKKLGVLRSRQE
jgi:GntR family transcriptional repressor for pyruvate dehydrogenase complex